MLKLYYILFPEASLGQHFKKSGFIEHKIHCLTTHNVRLIRSGGWGKKHPLLLERYPTLTSQPIYIVCMSKYAPECSSFHLGPRFWVWATSWGAKAWISPKNSSNFWKKSKAFSQNGGWVLEFFKLPFTHYSQKTS